MSRNIRIYISGQISGLPHDQAKQAFDEAEKALRNRGYDVVNPMNNGLPMTASWSQHMIADLKALLTCKAIYMLNGWKQSNGAKIEHTFAEMEGMRIYYELP